MKTFLILLSFVATSYAGVGVLTPEIEMKALELWMKYCDGASEGVTEDNTYIYCKKSTEVIEETLEHKKELESKSDGGGENIVFIEIPSIKYSHRIVVTGEGPKTAATKIYVKPQRNTHDYNVVDNTSKDPAASKPTLYFLKGSHGSPPAEK